MDLAAVCQAFDRLPPGNADDAGRPEVLAAGHADHDHKVLAAGHADHDQDHLHPLVLNAQALDMFANGFQDLPVRGSRRIKRKHVSRAVWTGALRRGRENASDVGACQDLS